MSLYTIKNISHNSITVSYVNDSGDLKEFNLNVNPSWDKEKIELEISNFKKIQEKAEIDLNLDQYFSVGDELEFIDYDPEKEHQEEQKKQEQENQRIIDEENQEFLNMVIEYRNMPVDYKGFRWYEYPKLEDQLDALYWMRQGVMEPIEEIDRQIKEIKEKYPKDSPISTNAALDATFPELRPTDYIQELKIRNIQADFIE
jgi:hypothetical protein